MPSQRERRESTRHAVVEAAIAEFTERGVADVSLDEIAARADVAKGTVLYHFGSRAGVLQSVAVAVIERVERRLAAITSAADLSGWMTAVLSEQATPMGRMLYGINDELTDAGDLDAIDPMNYLTRRLVDLGAGDRAEVTAAAMVQYGRMLARGRRGPEEVPAMVDALCRSVARV